MRRSISFGLVFAVLAVVLGGCNNDDDGGGNEGVIQYTAANFTVNEDGTVVTDITLSRTGGTAAISVTVIVSDGTATSADYVANNPIVVSWLAGDLADKTVTVGAVASGSNIEIVQDNDDEPDEFVNLSFGATTGGAVTGTQASATLTIIDDDIAGAAEFDTSSYFYLEDGTAIVPIIVNRVGGTAGAVSVTVVSTDGTANSDPLSLVEPVDYTPVSVVVSWADGDATPQMVTLSIVNDVVPETNEFFTIDLTNPTNGLLLGAIPNATVTILDDDDTLQIDNPFPVTNGLFGQSLARVGQRLAVGAPGNVAGAGRVYIMNVSDMTVFDELDGGALSQGFGWALAFGGSNTLAVGGQASAWAFDAGPFQDSFSLRYSGSNPDGGFGSAVFVAGGRVIVGAPQAQIGGSLEPSGRIYTYDELTGSPNLPIDGAADNQLGAAFALFNGDLLAGAPGNDGRVSRYSLTDLSHIFTVVNPFPLVPDPLFGITVATSGASIIVGAPDAHTFAPADGRVYVYDGVAPPQTVLPFGPAIANGRFGSHLFVLADGRVCVQQQGAGSVGEGQVLVYDTSWNLVQIINDPVPSAGANFGAAMAEFDGVLVVAAPNTPALSGTGSIYFIKLL